MAAETEAFELELQKTKKILGDPEGTIPFLFFDSIDSMIAKFVKQKKPAPWWSSIVIVAFAAQIPTLVVSLLLGEADRWRAYHIGLLWMGYILLGFSATLIARAGVAYLFRSVNSHVVDEIQRRADLVDLQRILKYVWLREGSRKNVIVFTVVFTIFWCLSFSAVYAYYLGVNLQEFGYGLFLGTIVFGILAAPALFMEAWFFIFILHVGNYKFRLNDTAPAHSEVVHRFSRTSTRMLYSFALFIAFATFAVSSDPVTGRFNFLAVLLVALIGWIPTIIYFGGSQVSINRIVTDAKWQTLNRIRDELGSLHNGDITKKENMEAINRLMDYHLKVFSTPSSTIGLGTSLNFITQLALPLIGLLLANLDKIRQLIFPGNP